MKMFMRLVTILTLAYSATHAQDEDIHRPKGRTGTAGNQQQTTNDYTPSRNPFVIGAELGLNYNMYSQGMARNIAIPTSPEDVLASGSGISGLGGFIIDWMVNDNLAFHARLVYDHKAWSNSISAIAAYDLGAGITEQAGTNSQYSAGVGYINFAPTLRYKFNPNVFASLGISFQRIVTDFTRSDKVSVADQSSGLFLTRDYFNTSGQFIEISRELINSNTNILPGSTINNAVIEQNRVGLEAGIGYEYPVNSIISVVPHIRYQFMFSPLHNSYSADDVSQANAGVVSTVNYSNPMVHSIQFSVGLWYSVR
ncbi:MAG: outer membrane beta-barrel protein [Candidatus Kapabacteria bacterium]|nr:outer membrane beta-barrel protein [Candidatus Kapabacteria bacterium]